MHRLIVTADDYGMSEAVNRAIDEGIDKGLITSTNVMTNMPYFKEAKKLTENPAVSVGMHWNLTCGTPVLPAKEIPTLVANNGDFFDYPEFRARYRKGVIKWEDIQKELSAQYERYRTYIGEADYWNTHQNSHVDFGIYKRFVQLAKSLGICRMRSHQRFYVKGNHNKERMPLTWQMLEPVKSKMLDTWQANAHKAGMVSPNGLVLCLDKADVYDLDYTFHHIDWKKSDYAEYVIHPATCNDSPYFGEIVDRRIWEYQAFTSFETKTILHDAGMELVDYKKLGKE